MYLFLQAEPFGKIISQLAEQEGVTEDKIMLSLSDINILGYDTPISVQLNVADIIGEYEINQYFCLPSYSNSTFIYSLAGVFLIKYKLIDWFL